MGRGVFKSTMGVVWVRAVFCWLVAVAAFFVGVVAGLVWLVSLAG
jgi:hypothetical protein